MADGMIRNWFARRRPRGAAVPFEAPALRMARVCDDERDGLIAILRDFANNGTVYIVPWSSLPLMAPMTDHDMATHKAVSETKATTPTQVRAVISRLALSGALGPGAKARESESRRAEQNRLADVELVLILHLLDSSGADLSALMADPARWRDADAKAAVGATAKTVGVNRQDIYRRIGEFTRLLAPVGLVATQGPIQSGWLRVLHDEIEGFGEALATSARQMPSEARPHLAAIAESAKRTAELAGTVLGMLDYAVLDIGGTVRRWTTEMPVLRQAIERLSLILDEWPSLMKMAHDALRGPPDELVGQLRLLRSMLPRMPGSDPTNGDHAPGEHADTLSVSQVLGARPIRHPLDAERFAFSRTVTDAGPSYGTSSASFGGRHALACNRTTSGSDTPPCGRRGSSTRSGARLAASVCRMAAAASS